MSTTRREFLKSTLGASTVLSLSGRMPGFLARAAAATSVDEANDRVLIMLQLSGGNDGLNSVVPFENDLYGRSRPTLRLRGEQVLKINPQLGFHPRMGGFKRIFDQGRLSVVQGVGYPHPKSDHAESMRIWQTGELDAENWDTGWLGRAVDQGQQPDAGGTPALFVGKTRSPLALVARRRVVPAIGALEQASIHTASGGKGRPQREILQQTALSKPPGDAGNLLDFARYATGAACANSRRIEEILAGSRGGPAAEYPRFGLARNLRLIAQLIRARAPVRIYFAELGGDGFGGFDNHANQAENHAALLKQLSASVAALVDDLARDHLLDRMLLMTFSEFGRTLAENGRRGTGHGSAAPVFVAGGRLAGGLVGAHPSLTELENGGPKHHTDFRRLYATALDAWLGIDSREVLGARFEPVAMLRG